MRNKWHYFLCLLAVFAIGFTCSSAYAFSTLDLGNGQELSIMGYVTQSVNYGLHEDYNTQHGFNGLLTNVVVETNYKFSDNAKFYISGMFTADWIYDTRTAGSWVQKGFDKSRVHGNSLYMDNDYWQLLKEAYVTWTPGNFTFKLGKQAVVWSEMDGFRLMDQINPMDSRRAISVVEIDTSLIPIWMARFEYNPQFYTSWFTDMNLQFVFNPNVTFIPNQSPATGNNIGGISAPQVNVNTMFGPAHIGETTMLLDRPKDLDSDGFAYAFRVSANVLGGRASLNYYYGRDHDPVTQVIGGGFGGFASDGKAILTTTMSGFYPLFRFVGASYSFDVPFMRSNSLGGVAPTFRLESIYAFNNTFSASNPVDPFAPPTFIHSDEFRFGVGVDWKVKIPWQTAYFTISPQYYYRRIMNYPSLNEITGLNQVNEMATLAISTSYLNAKLTPTIFWMHNISDKADMLNLSVGYQYSDVWQHSVGTFIFGGPKGSSFSMFDKKDYVYYKINYKF